MMHVLMGIMVIGLSVDYGVFIVNTHGGEVSKITRLSVTVCALSSLIGFGVLAFAKHPALHALGATVLYGISAALPTALWVAPILLEWNWRKSADNEIQIGR
jgi:predicted exporter